MRYILDEWQLGVRYEPWWFGCTGAAIAADGVDFDDWSQQVLSPTPPGKVLLFVSLPGGYFRMFLGLTRRACRGHGVFCAYVF